MFKFIAYHIYRWWYYNHRVVGEYYDRRWGQAWDYINGRFEWKRFNQCDVYKIQENRTKINGSWIPNDRILWYEQDNKDGKWYFKKGIIRKKVLSVYGKTG